MPVADRAEHTHVPTCFCGCGDNIKGMGPRGANQMGQKTTPVNDNLRAAHAVVTERHADGLYDRDPSHVLGRIEQSLAHGAAWETFWANFAHGGVIGNAAAFREDRRAWYEWTKVSAALTRAANLMPDALRARAVHGDER